jgi:hypothetical protein
MYELQSESSSSKHPSLDMTHAFIILVSSYDLIPQGSCDDDAEQWQVR